MVMQTEGSKRWEVYEHFSGMDEPGPVRAPGNSMPAYTLVLNPGDIFYVPPGRPHRAESGENWSLHVSIAAEPMTVRKVLQKKLEELIAQMPDEEIPALWVKVEKDPMQPAMKELISRLKDVEWVTSVREGQESQDHENDLARLLNIFRDSAS